MWELEIKWDRCTDHGYHGSCFRSNGKALVKAVKHFFSFSYDLFLLVCIVGEAESAIQQDLLPNRQSENRWSPCLYVIWAQSSRLLTWAEWWFLMISMQSQIQQKLLKAERARLTLLCIAHTIPLTIFSHVVSYILWQCSLLQCTVSVL